MTGPLSVGLDLLRCTLWFMTRADSEASGSMTCCSIQLGRVSASPTTNALSYRRKQQGTEAIGMRYTYTCTGCGATAHTTRGADLRNRSGRRCQSCKDGQASASGTIGDRVCRHCGCTDSRACETITGPCAWIVTYDDNTGVCTGCIAHLAAPAVDIR